MADNKKKRLEALLELLSKIRGRISHTNDCLIHTRGECDCGTIELRKEVEGVLKEVKGTTK